MCTGAARVYAIEADRVIDLAREVAAAAGQLDRVTFLEGYSTSVALPETADVLIYEDFSPLFFDTDMAEILRDARGRFLKPDARVLPRAASVWLAVVENEQDYREMLDPLVDEGASPFGLDLRSLREVVLNAPAYQELQPGESLAEPSFIHGIDFRRETPEPFEACRSFTISRPGTAHGLAVWFDLELAGGIELSNGPGTAGKELAAGGPPPRAACPIGGGRGRRGRGPDRRQQVLRLLLELDHPDSAGPRLQADLAPPVKLPRPAVAASPVTVSSAGCPALNSALEPRIPQADACPCR